MHAKNAVSPTRHIRYPANRQFISSTDSGLYAKGYALSKRHSLSVDKGGFSRAPIGHSMLSKLERVLHRQFQDALCRSPCLVIQHTEVIWVSTWICARILAVRLARVIDVVMQRQLVAATELRQWMVKEVERRSAELNPLPFRNMECLVHGQIAVKVGSATYVAILAWTERSNVRRSETGCDYFLIVASIGSRIAGFLWLNREGCRRSIEGRVSDP